LIYFSIGEEVILKKLFERIAFLFEGKEYYLRKNNLKTRLFLGGLKA